jgi:membrane associated rhomboid family serine protease
MGAYLLLFPHARVVTLIPIVIFLQVVHLPAVFFLGFWFLSQVFSGAISLVTSGQNSGGIAWWAHIGGFVVGVLWALVLKQRTPRRLQRRTSRYYDDDDWW